MTVKTINALRDGLAEVERIYGLHPETIADILLRISNHIHYAYPQQEKKRRILPAELMCLSGSEFAITRYIDWTRQLFAEDLRVERERTKQVVAIPTETLFETVERVQG